MAVLMVVVQESEIKQASPALEINSMHQQPPAKKRTITPRQYHQVRRCAPHDYPYNRCARGAMVTVLMQENEANPPVPGLFVQGVHADVSSTMHELCTSRQPICDIMFVCTAAHEKGICAHAIHTISSKSV